MNIKQQIFCWSLMIESLSWGGCTLNVLCVWHSHLASVQGGIYANGKTHMRFTPISRKYLPYPVDADNYV